MSAASPASADAARILILYATREGQAARVAARIAERLGEHGFRVTLAQARRRVRASLEGQYAASIVGASVHYGRHPAWLRKALTGQPTAFYSVSLSANPDYAAEFLRRVGWRPRLVASFAGALRYSRYGGFKRRLVQAFARVGGHSTDASRDHDYTDWAAVARFAEDFTTRLATV